MAINSAITEITTNSSMSVNPAPSGRFLRMDAGERSPGALGAFAPNRQYLLALHIIAPYLVRKLCYANITFKQGAIGSVILYISGISHIHFSHHVLRCQNANSLQQSFRKYAKNLTIRKNTWCNVRRSTYSRMRTLAASARRFRHSLSPNCAFLTNSACSSSLIIDSC